MIPGTGRLLRLAVALTAPAVAVTARTVTAAAPAGVAAARTVTAAARAVAAAPRAVATAVRAVAAAACVVALTLGFAIAVSGTPPPPPSNLADDAARIDDLFIFPVADPTLVAIAITVGSPVPRGSAAPAFDPHVLYAIHVDNGGDFKDHLTLQFLADGSTPAGPRQRILAYGPSAPATGSEASLLQTRLGSAIVNQTTILDKGVSLLPVSGAIRFSSIRYNSRAFAPDAPRAFAPWVKLKTRTPKITYLRSSSRRPRR